MTKIETTFEWPEPIPGFDPVTWKRQVHADMMRETEGMTKEEIREYFRRESEKFEADMARIRAERTAR